MIVKCEICGRPDHNSEVHPESRCWREQGTQSGRLDCFERGYVRLKAEFAAAEGRGRRRGVEEAIDVLQLMREHERVASHVALLLGAVANIRAGLPRDSAPVCDCEATLWGGGHIASCAAYPRGARK